MDNKFVINVYCRCVYIILYYPALFSANQTMYNNCANYFWATFYMCEYYAEKSIMYIPKSHIFFIQIGSCLQCDVELWRIGMTTFVYHSKNASFIMRNWKVFIWERIISRSLKYLYCSQQLQHVRSKGNLGIDFIALTDILQTVNIPISLNYFQIFKQTCLKL